MSPDSLYPDSITHCQDEPAVPPRPASGQPRSDADKADYTNQLHSAWGDCHDTVDATRDRKKAYQDQYDKATKSPIQRIFGGLGKKEKKS